MVDCPETVYRGGDVRVGRTRQYPPCFDDGSHSPNQTKGRRNPDREWASGPSCRWRAAPAASRPPAGRRHGLRRLCNMAISGGSAGTACCTKLAFSRAGHRGVIAIVLLTAAMIKDCLSACVHSQSRCWGWKTGGGCPADTRPSNGHRAQVPIPALRSAACSSSCLQFLIANLPSPKKPHPQTFPKRPSPPWHPSTR